MATLEELRRENIKLKNEREARKEQEEIGRERKRLESENYSMKHRRVSEIIGTSKVIGKMTIGGAKKIVEGYKKYNASRPVRKYKEGMSNLSKIKASEIF